MRKHEAHTERPPPRGQRPRGTPENAEDHLHAFESFGIGDDCPIFDGLYEYCQTYTGGSISGAARLSQGCSDIVMNWSGGMHHAKRGEASGFCYLNDIVLAILELLKVRRETQNPPPPSI